MENYKELIGDDCWNMIIEMKEQLEAKDRMDKVLNEMMKRYEWKMFNELDGINYDDYEICSCRLDNLKQLSKIYEYRKYEGLIIDTTFWSNGENCENECSGEICDCEPDETECIQDYFNLKHTSTKMRYGHIKP